MTVTIAGIAGSLRRGSYNHALLRAAACDLPPDVEFTIWDGLEQVPPFSETPRPTPPRPQSQGFAG
jgi:chromate reductase, NAD(P)H dehydrogenase (quinone)